MDKDQKIKILDAVIDEIRAELAALWHYANCPFTRCERCIADEPIIQRIRDGQAEVDKARAG